MRTMDLSPHTLGLPSLQYSATLEASGSDRRRDDRRRGRLNTELLTAVLEGNLAEVTRSYVLLFPTMIADGFPFHDKNFGNRIYSHLKEFCDPAGPIHSICDKPYSKRLEAGASVNASCRRTRTPVLQLAVACGHVEIAHQLLCRGAAVCLRDRTGRQAVHIAAATGSLLLLQLILDSDSGLLDSQVATGFQDTVDTDYLDSWSHDHDTVAEKIPELTQGATPLHLASQRLHLDCVTELLRRGAKVDITDKRGVSPLDVAGEIPDAPSTNILVDLADALPTSDETLTRIENIKRRISRNPSIKAFKLSMNRVPGSDKHNNCRNDSQVTDVWDRPFSEPSSPTVVLPNIFHPTNSNIVISSSKPSKITSSLALKVVNALIGRGACITNSSVIVKHNGVQNQMSVPRTCLHTAVEQQDLSLIEYLLDNGACQLSWNSDGLTCLHLAVTRGLLGSLKVLLEKNKTSQVIDSRDVHGRTPLLLSVAEQCCAAVSLLLEAGADVKVTSNDGQTVLHVAARLPKPQLLEELLTIPESLKIIESRNSQHETPLHCAVTAGQLACVQLLIARGADITTSLPHDITLLHLAAERGNKPILKTLLEDSRTSTFKNVRSKESKSGATALHLAVLGGFVDCVQVLLNSGCDVYAATTVFPYYGSTALHLAAHQGHCNVIEAIVKYDRKTLRMKNVDGWYPLHVAAHFAHKDCVKYMILNGGNLAATINDSGEIGKTALEIIVYSIVHPVTFLENIFDSCIKVNEYPVNHPKCVVKINYNVLQPFCPKRKQLVVLSSLLNCGKYVEQEKLLLHPLVETYLYLKWKKLRVFFFIMMTLHMVFTVSLTTMSMLFYVLKTESAVANTCVIICRITMCISLSLITFEELLQAARMQRYYVKDLESWVKWVTFLMATVVVGGHHPAPWLVHVSAIAVLLSWLELLFLLSRWPSRLGFYVLMFFTVAKNVLQVLATFTFVILGFTFAFMIHFQAKVPFDNWWEALAKVMVMTLEFDYGSLYEGISGVDATSIVGRSIFLSFMVLVAIVLMNLLVGLAVSDIATLEKQGRAQRLAKRIAFLSLLEVFVYHNSLYTCCPKKLSKAIKSRRATEPSLVFEPGKPVNKTHSLLTQKLRQSVINRIKDRKKVDEESLDEDVLEVHKSTIDSKSIFSSSPFKGSNQTENDISVFNVQTPFNVELRNKLDLIVSELAFMKREIENIKSKCDHL